MSDHEIDLRRTRTIVTVGAILAGLLLNLALPTILPTIPSVRASSRIIWLVGYQAGWNSSLPSGTNPDITVTEGDTITVNLSSGDVAHNFFVDLAGNMMWTCPPNVGCSQQFGPGTTTVTFTVNFAPGTYQYRCSIHLFSMHGNFIVQPTPDYSLSPNPYSLTINQGSTNTSRIQIVSTDNASGNVTLTASVSPSGPTVGINPSIARLSSTVRSANATLTVSIPSGTSPGVYSVTVTGDNSTVMHSATVEVSVPSPDFLLSLSSSSTVLVPRSSRNLVVNLTSIAGFSGTISLSVHVSSSGVNATLIPSTVMISPGAPATSILNLTTSSSTRTGVYNITITGSSTAGQHSTTLTLNVIILPGLPVLEPIDPIITLTVVVLLVAGLTFYLYWRRKPVRQTPVQ